LDRVSESLLLPNNNQSDDVGSSLVQTIETFIDKVVLPEDQEVLDIQTENITVKVSILRHLNA